LNGHPGSVVSSSRTTASNHRQRERLTGGDEQERASSASRRSSSLSLSGKGSAERPTALAWSARSLRMKEVVKEDVSDD
jgi:hypothetical protein